MKALILSLLMAGAASASVISNCALGSGGGGLVVTACSFATPAPGNENSVGQSVNTLIIDETFGPPTSPGGAVFALAAGAPTEYYVTKRVTNNTGLVWTDFEILFGGGNFGFLMPTTAFMFDYDQAPTISGPGTGAAFYNATQNLLTWSGLAINPGDTITLNFSIDINATGGGFWQIQQQPVGVPEPATLGLVGGVLLGLGVWRRQRR